MLGSLGKLACGSRLLVVVLVAVAAERGLTQGPPAGRDAPRTGLVRLPRVDEAASRERLFPPSETPATGGLNPYPRTEASEILPFEYVPRFSGGMSPTVPSDRFGTPASVAGIQNRVRLATGEEPVLLAPRVRTATNSITMHLADVDVREALEMISRTHRVNILVAPEVTGKVTLNFEDVPLNVALAGILRLCNLASQHDGELIFVYAGNKQPKEELSLRVFFLDYASAKDLLEGVKGLLSGSGQAFATNIDSEDNRCTREAIAVTDRPESLKRVGEYIVQMDQPPRQVMIEACILEITLSEENRHGINYKALLGRHFALELLGTANPAASPALFARLATGDVDALVECLQTTTDAKTLASPRLMVLNGQTAHIQVGGQLGYKILTFNQTSTMEQIKYLETGVVLEVTPQITRDSRVLLHVKPKVATGEVNTQTLLPQAETRELATDVLLANGQGMVIGGLIQEKDSAVRKKIPWLGDLYLIGKLFQRAEVTKSRSEVVVTLVPQILECGQPTSEQDAVNAERCRAPLFQGPLVRSPRPWEASLPDPIRNPRAPWPVLPR